MSADNRQWILLIALVGAIGVVGCNPPQRLEGSADVADVGTDAPSGNNGNNGGNDDNSDDDEDDNDDDPPSDTGTADVPADVPTVEFVQVADIIRQSCAVTDCHGTSAVTNVGFVVGADGSDASNSQIESALNGKTQRGEEVPLITPYRPRESGIYQALKGLNGRAQMPWRSADDFPDSKVETIKNWILQGAPYD